MFNYCAAQNCSRISRKCIWIANEMFSCCLILKRSLVVAQFVSVIIVSLFRVGLCCLHCCWRLFDYMCLSIGTSRHNRTMISNCTCQPYVFAVTLQAFTSVICVVLFFKQCNMSCKNKHTYTCYQTYNGKTTQHKRHQFQSLYYVYNVSLSMFVIAVDLFYTMFSNMLQLVSTQICQPLANKEANANNT